jgi:ABC-type multidrug transport system fused ATPase/permease subunit
VSYFTSFILLSFFPLIRNDKFCVWEESPFYLYRNYPKIIRGILCIFRSIMNVLPNLSSILEATIAATRILEMIERIPVIDSADGKGKILSYVRGEIEFKEVYFTYPSRPTTPILQGLNFKVEAGKTVGLVGGSGSGKSTIISLLERFYDPVKGDILLDQYKIKRLQLKWLRSQMGLVNQEPILFATSIKGNILFGKEEAPMDLVIHAAKAANAHDFIIELPQGYESQVSDKCFSYSLISPIISWFLMLNFTLEMFCLYLIR